MNFAAAILQNLEKPVKMFYDPLFETCTALWRFLAFSFFHPRDLNYLQG
jgi:hypothetical protein